MEPFKMEWLFPEVNLARKLRVPVQNAAVDVQK